MEDQAFFDWGGIGDGTEIGLFLPSAGLDGDWSMEGVDVVTAPTWNGSTACDQTAMDLDGGGLLLAVQASLSGTNDHGPTESFLSYLEDDGASSAQDSRSEADDSNAFSAPSSAFQHIEDPSPPRSEADNNASSAPSFAPSFAFIKAPFPPRSKAGNNASSTPSSAPSFAPSSAPSFAPSFVFIEHPYSRPEAGNNAFSAPSSAPSYTFIEDPSSRPEADNNASSTPSYTFIEDPSAPSFAFIKAPFPPRSKAGNSNAFSIPYYTFIEDPSARPEADNNDASSARSYIFIEDRPDVHYTVPSSAPPPSSRPTAYDQITWARPLQQDDTDEIISLGKSQLPEKRVPTVKMYERNATPNAADGMYDCEYCEERFPRAHAWKKHMDKHERPYKCTFEGCTNRDGFSSPCALMRHHEHLHLRKVQWFCIFEDCERHERGFHRSDHAWRHEERVHNYYRPDPEESICKWCKRGEITGKRPTKRRRTTTTEKDKDKAESPAEQWVIDDREAAATTLEEKIQHHKKELERLTGGLLRGVPDA
ncbi:hypothetical protein AYO21_11181 [Fonsecaea monophora]|uniref:C2H2-type domain-containing protein n=1 Tax=Fonsecaea monophora TaxID=254056 RepID=A0A177EUM3_9EURO|nr:hypothetical protein AYO21_11181 [Fonsecaea monophora]OAG34669.1 hypothetical protein AYO21_11181 [Fonsecaea monophora]